MVSKLKESCLYSLFLKSPKLTYVISINFKYTKQSIIFMLFHNPQSSILKSQQPLTMITSGEVVMARVDEEKGNFLLLLFKKNIFVSFKYLN